MAKDNKGNGKFKTWWAGLKSEFSKIIWLNRKTVIKQTVVVLVVTIIVGILITIIRHIRICLRCFSCRGSTWIFINGYQLIFSR